MIHHGLNDTSEWWQLVKKLGNDLTIFDVEQGDDCPSCLFVAVNCKKKLEVIEHNTYYRLKGSCVCFVKMSATPLGRFPFSWKKNNNKQPSRKTQQITVQKAINVYIVLKELSIIQLIYFIIIDIRNDITCQNQVFFIILSMVF